MCCIAPGGIADITIGPLGDIAAAEPTTIDEAIVATTTTTTTARAPRLAALENRIRPILKFHRPA